MKKNESTNNKKIFADIYSLKNYSCDWHYQQIIDIITNNKNISQDEIIELIKFMENKHMKNDNKSLMIIEAICVHQMNDAYCNVIIKFLKNKFLPFASFDRRLTHLIDKIISVFIKNNYKFTKEEHDILVNFEINKNIITYDDQKSNTKIKKINKSYFLNLMSTYSGFQYFLKNKQTFLHSMKKSKYEFDTEIFYNIIKTYGRLNNDMLVKNNDPVHLNELVDIIDFCIECGYKFQLNSAILMFSLFNLHSLVNHFSNKPDNYLINESNDQIMLKYFYELLTKYKINIADFINEHNILYSYFDESDIVEEYSNLNELYLNQIDQINKSYSVECAIMTCNIKKLKHNVNKKYIGTTNNLILSLYNYHETSDVEILEYLLSNESVVNSDVYEYMCVINIENEYDHLFVGTNEEKNKIIENTQFLKQIIIENSEKKFKKSKIKKYNCELIKKSKQDFLTFCRNDLFNNIINYIILYDTQIDNNTINSLLLNQNIDVILYVVNKYKMKPSLQHILLQQNLLLRYTLTKLYYPEICNFVQSSIESTIESTNKSAIESTNKSTIGSTIGSTMESTIESDSDSTEILKKIKKTDKTKKTKLN